MDSYEQAHPFLHHHHLYLIHTVVSLLDLHLEIEIDIAVIFKSFDVNESAVLLSAFHKEKGMLRSP